MPWSEPMVILEVYLDGVTITRTESGGVRAVGWQNVLDPGGGISERRIVMRAALPPWGLDRLRKAFRLLWPKPEHH